MEQSEIDLQLKKKRICTCGCGDFYVKYYGDHLGFNSCLKCGGSIRTEDGFRLKEKVNGTDRY